MRQSLNPHSALGCVRRQRRGLGLLDQFDGAPLQRLHLKAALIAGVG
jgi:hypothetical protein